MKWKNKIWERGRRSRDGTVTQPAVVVPRPPAAAPPLARSHREAWG
jgi:hypothetical protein